MTAEDSQPNGSRPDGSNADGSPRSSGVTDETSGGLMRRSDMKDLGLAWTLVIEFLGFLVLLGGAGWWLDKKYGWGNRGLLGGLLLAVAAWVYRVIRQTWYLFK